jgi:hypothetical protein
MTFPRKTDVAMHMARKPRLVSKLRPEIIPIKEVPEIDVQLLPVVLLAASVPARPSLISDDLGITFRSAHNENTGVAR